MIIIISIITIYIICVYIYIYTYIYIYIYIFQVSVPFWKHLYRKEVPWCISKTQVLLERPFFFTKPLLSGTGSSKTVPKVWYFTPFVIGGRVTPVCGILKGYQSYISKGT